MPRWQELQARHRRLALALALGSWVLLAPDPRGTFGSAGACRAEQAAWLARAQGGAGWVGNQARAALQKDQAFWAAAVARADRQLEAARAARCVEARH